MLAPILEKYLGVCNRWKSCFSYNRDVFTKWTLLFINFLMFNVSPEDFYTYLVQVGFIKTSFVVCDRCKIGMALRVNNESSTNLHYVCSNKVIDPITGRFKTCGKRKSVFCNSWFAKSKLKLGEEIVIYSFYPNIIYFLCIGEILILTYMWYYNVSFPLASHDYGFKRETVYDWASYCREVAIDAVFVQSQKIGGMCIVTNVSY